MAVVVIVSGPFVASQGNTTHGLCDKPAMFGSGYRIGTMTVTMVHQLMVQLGNHLQALPGLVAAAPGTTAPGTCGRRIAAASRPAPASTSGFACQVGALDS